MTTIKSELAIIPPWAYVPAAFLLIGVPVLFMTFVWPGTHDSPTFPFQVLMSFLPGTFLGFLMLMVGYVNVDAKRRAMNRTTWTLIVILVPNAIGFIIYFLMRSPIQDKCPQCATMIDSRANFCPA